MINQQHLQTALETIAQDNPWLYLVWCAFLLWLCVKFFTSFVESIFEQPKLSDVERVRLEVKERLKQKFNIGDENEKQ